jgi:precorrin-2 dehydrogenase / sirohydrochlorin ferrochelatase
VADRFAVMVDLDARPVLVVGGGAVATRKVLGLLRAGAQVTVVAPDLSAPLAELAAREQLRWVPSTYFALGAPEDVGGRWAFVVAATDDAATNARVAADAARAGTWANDASAPDGGTAAMPASRRTGSLTVAVSTGGVHPAAARWALDRAVEALGPEVVVALDLMAEVRHDDLASGGPGRRPDWRAAVASGTLDLIRSGQLAEAKERLEACLSSSSD